jgi:hypothetical protein
LVKFRAFELESIKLLVLHPVEQVLGSYMHLIVSISLGWVVANQLGRWMKLVPHIWTENL